MRFVDRSDAGRRLGHALAERAYARPIVLALPRGGVPVGFEVARALNAPLDVLVVRKIGAPLQPELGLGAVAETGQRVLDSALVDELGVSERMLAQLIERARDEAHRRVQLYRGGRPLPDLRGRTVILVDDGVATGGSMQAAISALQVAGAARLVVAVPVAAAATLIRLRAQVDEAECLSSPSDLLAVGDWYDDFLQLTDEEVLDLLARARPGGAPNGRCHSTPVRVQAGVPLEGDLTVPPDPRGLVVFAHGSGSCRRAPRNRFTARTLQQARLATLLFDLLSVEEDGEDEIDGHLRFDIDLLALRMVRALDWIAAQPGLSHFGLGLFGSSTGTAAALIAASERQRRVRAVVSRGGRPDLALWALPEVRAPTLLVVGGADPEVLQLNRKALQRLGAPAQLDVVRGATHLFEEPGALEDVALRAAAWFSRFLPLQPAAELALPYAE